MHETSDGSAAMAAHAMVKCVVWDLDDTLWSGVLQEGDDVTLREGVGTILRELDGRGILHSIASRSDEASSLARLRSFGIDQWFLCPQVHWGSKDESIRRIAEALNIGLDAILLVDDDPYEREEVRAILPDVRTVDSADLHSLLEFPDLDPPHVTPEAVRRRSMYLEEQRRTAAEREFTGSREDFLASLRSTYTIREALPGDLERASELTMRTHQLNATGSTCTSEELEGFRRSDHHGLLVMELEDRFGSFGIVGVALIHRAHHHSPASWTIRLLLTSCRVMSRGAGAVLLQHVVARAHERGVRLRAEFVHTGRNRTLYAMYKFAGFSEAGHSGDVVLLERGPTAPRSTAPRGEVVSAW